MIGNLDAFDAPIERLSKFDQRLKQYAVDLMQSPEVDELLSQINVDQLNKGKRSDGTDIDPAYTAKTVRIKREKGQEADFVTLRDEGNFQAGIRAVSYKTKVMLMSTDPKSAGLQEKYDEAGSILGVDNDNLFIVRDFLKPKFLYFTRKNLTS